MTTEIHEERWGILVRVDDRDVIGFNTENGRPRCNMSTCMPSNPEDVQRYINAMQSGLDEAWRRCTSKAT